MKALSVLVVVHESLVPPDHVAGLSEQRIDEFRTERDVIETLRGLGHQVEVLGLLDSLSPLRQALTERKPDVVFNLLEEFNGIVTYDQHVVAYLELMRQPYTGCNPRGLLLSRDKPLTKKLLSYHRIATPRFKVLKKGVRFVVPKELVYPLIVKSATEDASLGIAQASVVGDVAHLKDRVEFIHTQIGTDALVEEFIEGRELYVGVLGNERLTTLPPWELHFGSMAEGSTAASRSIATRKVKWDRRYQARHGIHRGAAEALPKAVLDRLQHAARRTYRTLGLSGYARMDFRLRADGEVFLLEANANPCLAAEDDFARSAASAGVEYPALLTRILSLGRHYQAEWRAGYG
jgi:D-alanine-D-alanine ligase